MRQRWLVVPVVLGTSFMVVGCATKKFVREEVGKSEGKTQTQIQRLDGDVGQEKTRLTGVAQQVTESRGAADEATRRADQANTAAVQAAGKAEGASAQAIEAQAKAGEARGAADRALAKTDETDQRVTRLWANRNKRTLGETVVIAFGFNRWTLDDRGETTLLEIVKQLQENADALVDLEGYTDSAGAAPYNVQLSQRRAETVRRFLVGKGIDVHRVQSIGLGDLRPVADNKSKQGRDQNRRVAVKLFLPLGD